MHICYKIGHFSLKCMKSVLEPIQGPLHFVVHVLILRAAVLRVRMMKLGFTIICLAITWTWAVSTVDRVLIDKALDIFFGILDAPGEFRGLDTMR
jgi:hypothetical protein